MRIIDKNHDYYDYLQDPTDNTLVFDRRGSFILEKSQICHEAWLFKFTRIRNREINENNYIFLELQCGGTFWVFLMTFTKFTEEYFRIYEPEDYDIELVATWKDYSKPNKLLDINLVNMNFTFYNFRTKKTEMEKERITPENIKRIFEEKYTSIENIGTHKVYTNKEVKTYTIPILNACGISKLVPALDMFCAIEEYFSREKTASERTEAIGTTNDDKIIMHGFDTKTSFRGKQKKEK